MKKLFIISAIFILLSSCNNSPGNDEDKGGTDSASLKSPSAIDTTIQPGGMDNSSVISNDTAAMNVQNLIKKADSIAEEKNKK